MIDPKTIDWRVYAIINADGDDPVALAGRCVAAGVGVVQLRDKRADGRAMAELGRELIAVCGSIPLIVNDRVDVALAIGAAGVHLGPHDLSVEDARSIAPTLLIGASVGTPDEARAAVAAGANYLGHGAVFDASASKPDAHHNRGLDALRTVVNSVDVPVVGIGGISSSNAHLVRKTGAAGVAVIRALAEAANINVVVDELRG